MRTPVSPPYLLSSPAGRFMPLLAKVAAGLGVLWLLGWLALPLALKPLLEQQASQALGRTVTVDAVNFQPWSLELEVLGLRVGFADASATDAAEKSDKNTPQRLTDKESQLFIQRIYVDAELSSVLRRAPVVDAVQIDHPVLNVRHTGQGRHDLQDVLDRLAKPSDPPEPDTGPARLAIYNIQLLNGQVNLFDAPENNPHTLTDITLSVPFISTLGVANEVRVSPKLAFKLNGSPFETEAQTQPFNLSRTTEATLKISGLNLTPYLDYLPKDLAVRPVQATLGAELKVEFAQMPQTQVRITGHLGADKVALNDAHQQPLLTLGSARVELADVRPLERVALLGLVELNEPQAHLSRNAQGVLNTEQEKSAGIAKKSINQSAEAQKSIKNKPAIGQGNDGWTLGVTQLKVAGGGVNWADALTPDANKQPARLALNQLQVNAQQLHWPLPTEPSKAVAFDAAAQLGGGAAAKAPGKAPAPAAVKAGVPLAAATKPAAPASLSLKGTVLASQADATVGLNDLALSVLAPYLSVHLTPTVQGQMSLNAQVSWKPAGTAPDSGTAKPGDLTLTLNQLNLTQLKLVTDNGTEVASLQALEVRDAQLRPLEHTANLGKVSITRPVLPVQRNPQGQLMFAQWLKAAPVTVQSTEPLATKPPPPPSSQPASANTPAPTWAWQLPELSVTDGQFGWLDELPTQTVALQTSAFKLMVKGLASSGGVPATVAASMRVAAGQTEPGTLGWQGTVSLGDDGQTPRIKGQLDARRLPVHALAPYAADQLNLNLLRADTSFNGNVVFSASAAGPTVQLVGNATLEDFRAHTTDATGKADKTDKTDKVPATNTATEGNELLHWKTLNLKGLSVALAPATATQVSVQSGALSDFFARIVIQADGRINLQNIGKQAAADAATAATPAVTDPLATRISIGPFSLVNGAVDFSDKFIRPNYQANLSDLTGRLGGFSSDGASATTGDTKTPQMADLELRGKAEGSASLEIVGKLNPLAKPLALDIEGHVRDLELPPLSPYAIKYTGHGIERGKLSLDVAYAVLPNGQLTARNQLVLNQLTFGEPVAGAPASLPVKLAVALLADRQGVIDLDLPISGSLNDPEFSLVPIVFKIIGNIIVKAITAPFALLTGALGGDSNELSQLAFVPGTARLVPASTDKLTRVAKALTDKPNLKLTVVGAASLDAERTAYQRARLQAMVLAEQARNQPATEPASTGLTGADYTRWLAAVYKRTDMPKPRNAIGMAQDIAPEDMEALLLAQIPATDSQMQELAVQRGVAVRDHLARLKVPTQRLFLGAPTTQPKQEGSSTWQPAAELKLAM